MSKMSDNMASVRFFCHPECDLETVVLEKYETGRWLGDSFVPVTVPDVEILRCKDCGCVLLGEAAIEKIDEVLGAVK